MNFLARFSTLQITLGISIALHAALLTVRFVDPHRFDRIFRDMPLEVILVNARSEDAPDKAQLAANAALAGGGEADQGRATSPLPYSALTAIGEDLERVQREMDSMLEQQSQLLAQVRRQLATLPEPDMRQMRHSDEQQEQVEKRRQLQKLLAEIEMRIQEENARPRKRYVSPATMQRVDAIYYDNLRRKIEAKGTQDFPVQSGKKLYGELIMIVTINHDGSVLETELAEGSGIRDLDRQALEIAKKAGPFGPFSQAMREHADQIAIVSRFKFIHDTSSGEGSLQTEVGW